MSVWLDSSSNSNKFKQSYFRDFVDVSGDVLVRNGLSLKLYNNNVPTRVQFSVNSKEFHIYNDTDQTYYDISNTKLIHLQDLSENVQSKLTRFTDRTKYIATDISNSDTMIEFNKSQNMVKIYTGLDVSSNIVGLTDLSINRNVSIGGNTTVRGRLDVCGNFYANYPNNSIPVSAITDGVTRTYVDLSLNSKASIVYVDTSLNSKASIVYVDTSLNSKASIVYVDTSLNSKASIVYVDTSLNSKASIVYVDLSLNSKASIVYVDTSLNSKASIVYVDTSLNSKANNESPTFTGIVTASKVSISSDASFSGRVDICGNFYAQYPPNSIPASAIIGGIGGAVSPLSSLGTNITFENDFALIKEAVVDPMSLLLRQFQF